MHETRDGREEEEVKGVQQKRGMEERREYSRGEEWKRGGRGEGSTAERRDGTLQALSHKQLQPLHHAVMISTMLSWPTQAL